MTKGVGVDIERVKNIKKASKNRRFLELVYTKEELEYCLSKKEPNMSLTGRFCAKEAILKAIKEQIPMNRIRIAKKESGKLAVFINGKRRKDIKVSISHTDEYAVGFAVLD